MLPPDAPPKPEPQPAPESDDTPGKAQEGKKEESAPVANESSKKDEPAQPLGPSKRDLALAWLDNKMTGIKMFRDELVAKPDMALDPKRLGKVLWIEARASFAFEITWNKLYADTPINQDFVLGPELTPQQEEKIKKDMEENNRLNEERRKKEKEDRISMGPKAYNQSRRLLKKNGKSAR